MQRRCHVHMARPDKKRKAVVYSGFATPTSVLEPGSTTDAAFVQVSHGNGGGCGLHSRLCPLEHILSYLLPKASSRIMIWFSVQASTVTREEPRGHPSLRGGPDSDKPPLALALAAAHFTTVLGRIGREPSRQHAACPMQSQPLGYATYVLSWSMDAKMRLLDGIYRHTHTHTHTHTCTLTRFKAAWDEGRDGGLFRLNVSALLVFPGPWDPVERLSYLCVPVAVCAWKRERK